MPLVGPLLYQCNVCAVGVTKRIARRIREDNACRPLVNLTGLTLRYIAWATLGIVRLPGRAALLALIGPHRGTSARERNLDWAINWVPAICGSGLSE